MAGTSRRRQTSGRASGPSLRSTGARSTSTCRQTPAKTASRTSYDHACPDLDTGAEADQCFGGRHRVAIVIGSLAGGGPDDLGACHAPAPIYETAASFALVDSGALWRHLAEYAGCGAMATMGPVSD